jgi:YggT family protein
VTPFGATLYLVLNLFFILLLVRLVLSFVFQFARSYQPRGPMLVLCELTFSVTDPPYKALRAFLPPLRLGPIAVDLAFLILMVIVKILIRLAVRL